MAFWGVEVEPGKPYLHHYSSDQGRLHISQATLGTFSSTKRSILQCNVGDKRPINVCTLYPERLETCPLNLEFEEDEEVTFSVIGPHSVHLCGFFFGESEDGGDSEVDFSDDDEDDTDDDDDLEMYPSSPVRKSGVKIEEIVEDENPSNGNGASKQSKNKNSQISKSINDRDSETQTVVRSGTGVSELESEDEDGFPIASCGDELDKSCKKNDLSHGKSLKRKAVVDQDGEMSRRDDQPVDPSVRINMTSRVNENKQNKKNKKKKVSDKEEMANETAKNSDVSKGANSAVTEQNVGSEKEKEKKKKKQGNAADIEQSTTGKSGSSMQTEEKAEAKPSQVRTFPNGLVIEKLAMGIPDGKKAAPGKKVSVRYIGKLKKNDKIFDSNIGRAPFKFRLGIGEVIKGWDVGVNGMRIGDKRRLTIPPAMGYGARGAGQAIPPNSWLVFDVELVDVN